MNKHSRRKIIISGPGFCFSFSYLILLNDLPKQRHQPLLLLVSLCSITSRIIKLGCVFYKCSSNYRKYGKTPISLVLELQRATSTVS